MIRLILATVAALFSIPLTTQAQVPVSSLSPAQQLEALKDSNPIEAKNKRLVYDFWREVFVARDMAKLDGYMAESYIQHNPSVPTGRAAFLRFFSTAPKGELKPSIDNLVAITGDNDLVVLAFRRELPDPANPTSKYTTTWFDMLRVEGGKVAEHWDYGTKSAQPRPAN